MKNLKIAGSLAMLFGVTLYFLTPQSMETFAGAIFGVGFGLVIFSFMERNKI